MGTLARVHVVWTGLPGFPALSTFWFGAGVGTASTRDAALRNFLTAIKVDILLGITMTVQPEQTMIDSDTGVPTGVEVGPGALGIGGTNTGEQAAHATQALLRLSTATYIGSRRLQGRLFIPAMSANNVRGTPLPAFVTRMNTAAENFRAAVATSSPWMVYSRPFPGSPGDPTATPPKAAKPARTGTASPVTAVTCWDNFAVLRSRRD